jgi:UDP-N-acetyl-D-galactosamine dehydrogenase
MGSHIVGRVVKLMNKRRIHVADSNVLILGLTFKENCPDLRNTRVIDIIEEFQDYNANVHVYDPWVNPAEAEHEYGITLTKDLLPNTYDAVILAVSHHQFMEMGVDAMRKLGKEQSVLFDVKSILPVDKVDDRL